ncbi:cysteine synthase A [Neocallimastix californiae]|jgi:cysteine synthase A|uniref:Cysteine synthase n=1 Tax=Neocallimastix californiae TaxID=1754190 RepID=A0A1Y2AZV7_9FUNG|nr:cysteine synthase A [Neocallimastix californiae]|eukprot:ORY27395.1 cysteine synthase A [Neocallimastix californiae]
MPLKHSVTDLIGNTPLVQLHKFDAGGDVNLLVKLEYFNPASSVKDRIALALIEDAEQRGVLKPDSIIVEPTSGNTGIGLASVGRAKGYHVIIVLPDSMSIERRKLIKGFGAELVLTPGKLGMQGAVDKANEIAAENPNAFIPQQFNNPANAAYHERVTGEEIWNDAEGKIDYFVAGVGTGGTVSGVGAALKKHNPNIKIVAVEPSDSPLLSTGKAGPHKIQGIGANFVPKNYHPDVIDEIITIGSEESGKAVHDLSHSEGILVGISSGAALAAARKLASRPENIGKTIVALLPDSGERYLSTWLFN